MEGLGNGRSMGRSVYFLLFLFMTLNLQGKEVWVSVDADAVGTFQRANKLVQEIEFPAPGIALMKVEEYMLPKLGELMHHKHGRCGGFVVHEDSNEAQSFVNDGLDSQIQGFLLPDYSINQRGLVQSLLPKVESRRIYDVIEKLSAFHNRYYQSSTGVKAIKWIGDYWGSIVANRSDARVEYYNHSRWKQPSVILTIKGSSKPDEVIVIGGHADSIAGWLFQARSRAPGADDNASGIATISEVIKVLVDSSYRPERTLKFMGYAAEEVGLRGSKEIARKFKRDGVQVVGVLQLDMTNYQNGSLDMVIVDDYTNKDQNRFLGKLIDEYVKVPWGHDRCGYACSDHASWYMSGFPASSPFEAKKRNMNKSIHTARDTLARSGNHARHAAKFAKLALSYVVELDR